MATAAAAGLARMRAYAGQLPEQLRHGFRTGVALEFALPPRAIFWGAAGMGGSAIASDLVSGLLARETDRTLSVHRGPTLPKAVDGRWLVVLTSYSGNTWETRAAYDRAGAQGAARLVISAGGALTERAAEDGVPCLVVPGGLPPRAAVGYLLGGLLGALDPCFPESNEGRLDAASERVVRLTRRLERRGSAAQRLARAIGPRSPYLYAEEGWSALARRWKTQIEENAKRLAHVDLLPELLHNALVPWDALPRAEAKRRAVVLLEPSPRDDRLGRRFRYLERVLRGRGVSVSRVALTEPDALSAMVSGIAWGDAVSLWLAENARVDPFEIRALESLKAAFPVD